MMLRTHYTFSAGLLALALAALFRPPLYETLTVALLVSATANSVIDMLGHKGGRRTPLTHTVPRSVAWGLASSLLAAVVVPKALPLALAAGAIAGPSHMLLDVITEHGIYVKRNGHWRRLALAHIRYNNPLANLALTLLGVLFLVLAILI
ncbi:MAG: DUF1286 domain-containing protein [Thermoproteus sp.]